MPRSDDSSEKLRRHFESTYLSLRIGIAVARRPPHRGKPGPTHFRALGVLTARLHLHAQRWLASASCPRSSRRA